MDVLTHSWVHSLFPFDQQHHKKMKPLFRCDNIGRSFLFQFTALFIYFFIIIFIVEVEYMGR